MKNLQVFLKITGETLFLSSVFTLNLGINLSHAAKMHGCQGKSSAKVQETLPFGVVFNRFMIKNLLLQCKNLLIYNERMV